MPVMGLTAPAPSKATPGLVSSSSQHCPAGPSCRPTAWPQCRYAVGRAGAVPICPIPGGAVGWALIPPCEPLSGPGSDVCFEIIQRKWDSAFCKLYFYLLEHSEPTLPSAKGCSLIVDMMESTQSSKTGNSSKPFINSESSMELSGSALVMPAQRR